MSGKERNRSNYGSGCEVNVDRGLQEFWSHLKQPHACGCSVSRNPHGPAAWNQLTGRTGSFPSHHYWTISNNDCDDDSAESSRDLLEFQSFSITWAVKSLENQFDFGTASWKWLTGAIQSPLTHLAECGCVWRLLSRFSDGGLKATLAPLTGNSTPTLAHWFRSYTNHLDTTRATQQRNRWSSNDVWMLLCSVTHRQTR